MGDIVIDDEYLATTQEDLRGLGQDLSTLCDSLRGLDGLVVGAAPVFDELHEFGEAWSRATEELAEEADGAVDYLSSVLQTFDDIDFSLAEELLNEEVGD